MVQRTLAADLTTFGREGRAFADVVASTITSRSVNSTVTAGGALLCFAKARANREKNPSAASGSPSAMDAASFSLSSLVKFAIALGTARWGSVSEGGRESLPNVLKATAWRLSCPPPL